jgi:hypothetical protein
VHPLRHKTPNAHPLCAVRPTRTASRPESRPEGLFVLQFPHSTVQARSSSKNDQREVSWHFRGGWKGVWLFCLVGMLLCFRTTVKRRLSMQINHPTPPSLKRSFAQTASTPHQASDSLSTSTSKSQRRRRSTSPHQRHQPMSSPSSHLGHSAPGSPRTGSPSSYSSYRTSPFRGSRDSHSRNNSRSRFPDREKDRDSLELPLRDEKFVKQTYEDVKLPTTVTNNPKSSITNLANQALDGSLDFKSREGIINKQKLWRWVFLRALRFTGPPLSAFSS